MGFLAKTGVTKQACKREKPMNETFIVTSFVVIDEVLKAAGHKSHMLAQVPASEILWLTVVLAIYFQNHHERTMYVMQRLEYLSGKISISRFNRRLHQLSVEFQNLVHIHQEFWH